MLQNEFDVKQFGALLIDIGIALLSSGASSSRIRNTMERFANACNLEPHFIVNPKSIAVTLINADRAIVFTGLHSTHVVGVNFKTLSGLSRLSWRFIEEEMTLQQVREELVRLQTLPPYSRWLVLLMVSLAGSAFCFTFGGDFKQMCITFIATFAGLFINQEMKKYQFNLYICTYVGALVATFTTSLFYMARLDIQLEQAYATCVLFLIPGVPLINSFSDLIDGQTLSGIERGAVALLHTLAIAFGLSTILFLYKLYS